MHKILIPLILLSDQTDKLINPIIIIDGTNDFLIEVANEIGVQAIAVNLALLDPPVCHFEGYLYQPPLKFPLYCVFEVWAFAIQPFP
jgi:hypothetical protein